MEWAALFKIIQSWGPSAISSALVIVVVYLIKKIDCNSEKEAKRSKELRDYIDKTLNGFGSRISVIEHEYLKRETFYRELGGWKDDINRLSGQIANLFSEFNRSIIELWKGKKDQ